MFSYVVFDVLIGSVVSEPLNIFVIFNEKSWVTAMRISLVVGVGLLLVYLRLSIYYFEDFVSFMKGNAYSPNQYIPSSVLAYLLNFLVESLPLRKPW